MLDWRNPRNSESFNLIFNALLCKMTKERCINQLTSTGELRFDHLVKEQRTKYMTDDAIHLVKRGSKSINEVDKTYTEMVTTT